MRSLTAFTHSEALCNAIDTAHTVPVGNDIAALVHTSFQQKPALTWILSMLRLRYALTPATALTVKTL